MLLDTSFNSLNMFRALFYLWGFIICWITTSLSVGNLNIWKSGNAWLIRLPPDWNQAGAWSIRRLHDQNQAAVWSIRQPPKYNQAAAWLIRHLPDWNQVWEQVRSIGWSVGTGWQEKLAIGRKQVEKWQQCWCWTGWKVLARVWGGNFGIGRGVMVGVCRLQVSKTEVWI